MTEAFDLARLRASGLEAATMLSRRKAVRRARRKNSYLNLKKLMAKHRLVLVLLGVCCALLIVLSWVVRNSTFTNSMISMPIAPVQAQALPSKAQVIEPTNELPPVTASGDETVVRLKLSTEILSITNLPLEKSNE